MVDKDRALAIEVVKAQATNGDELTGIKQTPVDEWNDQDSAPLTIDLVTFVIWLREHTDFFSGPDLTLHFPRGDDPDFTTVLAQNALLYTGE